LNARDAMPDGGRVTLSIRNCDGPIPGRDELRSAFHRRKRELQVARQKAEQALRSELKDSITALLRSCEMVLDVPNLLCLPGPRCESSTLWRRRCA
jgi:hypothetical protein